MTTNLKNAIAKASRIKCHVKPQTGRAYTVTTPQLHRYTVRFEEYEGEKYGRCNCKAGAAHMPCYHLIPAALVDTALSKMRAH